MTWYCWNHWFWITGLTVICLLLTFNSVYSYPISPIDEIKEYNIKKSPLQNPINSSPNDDHDIDDVYMGQQNIPLPTTQLIKEKLNKIIENNNQLLEKNDKIMQNLNKTIEDNLILNRNQSNNNNNNKNNKLINISNVIKLVPDDPSNKLKNNNHENISLLSNINETVAAETENINFSNFSIISTNNKTLTNIQLNESANSSQSNIMQIKNYNINSTIFPTPLSSFQSHQIFEENNESATTVTFDNSTANYDDDNEEIGNITKLDLVTITTTTIINSTINDNPTESSAEKISTKLENVTKMINDSYDRNIETEYLRKSNGFSSEYRDGSRSINFPTETKSLLTRSAVSSDLQLYHGERQHEDGNVSSEALQITGVMDAGTISGICFAVFALCVGVSMFGIILYRRRFLNKPQTLNEPDSSVYIDDSTIRDNSDEMYSLDNDSFLNSLEAMTIQNYWTDTVKHTKL